MRPAAQAQRQRPDPAPAVPRTPLGGLAIGVILLCVVGTTVPFRVGVEDTWLQITMGRYILSHGLPRVDHFTYTSRPTPIVEHEWLTDIVFSLAYTTGGAAGLLAVYVVCMAAVYGLALATARTLGASGTVLAALFPLLVGIVLARAVLRPHLISWIGLLVTHLTLYNIRLRQWHPRWVWGLLPLLWVWSQMHGGWIVGLATLAVWSTGEAAAWLRARVARGPVPPALPGRVVVSLAALVPLGLGVACLGPYGLDLVTYPLREAQIEAGLNWNDEWLAFHRLGYFNLQGVFYLIFLALTWLTWLHRWRVARGHSLGLIGIVTLFLGILGYAATHPPAVEGVGLSQVVTGQPVLLGGLLAVLVLWGVHLGMMWRTIDLSQSLLILAVVGLSLRYSRAVADAALQSFPILAAALTPLVYAWAPRVQRAVRVSGAVGALGFLGWLTLTLWPGPTTRNEARVLGFGVSARPQHTCVAEFLTRHDLQGHVFTTIPNWLLLQRWPWIRVQSDARQYVHPVAEQRAHEAAFVDVAGLQAFLSRWPTDYIVVNHLAFGLEQYQWLVGQQGWRFVHLNDRFSILASPTPAHARLIRDHAYHYLLPWRNQRFPAAAAAAVLEEATRALAECRGGATFAHAYQAVALSRLGRDAEARAAAQQIPPFIALE